MHIKTKFFITLFFIFISTLFFQNTFAKYVIEDINMVAKIDIDRCKPEIELVDIATSNTSYPNYANQSHVISGHIKITEKNMVKNNFSKDTFQITVGNELIIPNFTTFFLCSENANEKIYEFSFTHTVGNGNLVIMIPEGIVEDISRINQ